MSGIIRSFTDLPGWIFEIAEVSAGLFKVTGTDVHGRRVEASGIDDESVLNDCKKFAVSVSVLPDENKM